MKKKLRLNLHNSSEEVDRAFNQGINNFILKSEEEKEKLAGRSFQVLQKVLSIRKKGK